jgi:uncharacterized YigZ family protein
MRIITEEVMTEFSEKKSRFISILTAVRTQEEARMRIRTEWERYPDATHIVYAFRIGKSGDLFGMSDDGEPYGTAGRPVFEVLKGSGITNVLLMVVRYFGGTKLGTGGLVKAYTRAAQEVLSACRTEELTEKVSFSLEVPYQLHDQVLKALHEEGAAVEDEQFATKVSVRGTLPAEAADGIRRRLQDLSSGSLELKVSENREE